MEAFQTFFREHSEHWLGRFDYQEAGPQLLLQAYLQRIVNGGGRIEREYGLGSGRTDLLIVWPFGASADGAAEVTKTVIGAGTRPAAHRRRQGGTRGGRSSWRGARGYGGRAAGSVFAAMSGLGRTGSDAPGSQ